ERGLRELEEAAQGRRLPDLAEALGRRGERRALGEERALEAGARVGVAALHGRVVDGALGVGALAVGLDGERGLDARVERRPAVGVARDLILAGEEVD